MTETNGPSDALVICTRNRLTDIQRCLASVAAANHIPGRIIVVDSSDGRETEEYCSQSDLPITYIKAPRGLTIQRNIALTAVEAEIVHFIDDDVEVDPDYFRALIRAFRDSPKAAGVGGAMAVPGAGRPSLRSRLLLKTSVQPGRVLRSGYNTGCYDMPRTTSVDWLPGCSMSFRMSVIAGLRFDERRKGYALGEDVDFGLKALDRGPLLYIPTARLVHHLSPENRAELPNRIRAAVHNRWALALDFPDRVSRGLVIYSSVIEGLLIATKSIGATLLKPNVPMNVKKERAFRRKVAAASFAGVFDVLRRGSNVDL